MMLKRNLRLFPALLAVVLALTACGTPSPVALSVGVPVGTPGPTATRTSIVSGWRPTAKLPPRPTSTRTPPPTRVPSATPIPTPTLAPLARDILPLPAAGLYAVGSETGACWLLPPDGQPIPLFSQGAPVSRCVFSPDGARLAFYWGEQLMVYDYPSGTLTAQGESNPTPFSTLPLWSPDSARLADVLNDNVIVRNCAAGGEPCWDEYRRNEIRVLDPNTGKVAAQRSEGGYRITDMQWLGNGSGLLYGSSDSMGGMVGSPVHIWLLDRTDAVIATLGESVTFDIQVSPNGRWAAVISDQEKFSPDYPFMGATGLYLMDLWCAGTPETCADRMRMVVDPYHTVRWAEISWAPDGKTFLFPCNVDEIRPKICRFDMASETFEAVYPGGDIEAGQILLGPLPVFAPDGASYALYKTILRRDQNGNLTIPDTRVQFIDAGDHHLLREIEFTGRDVDITGWVRVQ